MRKKKPFPLPLCPTLVVGGEHSFVKDKLSEQLARHGLRVVHHWEWRKKPGAFVARIDVVFIVTDMVGHDLNDHVRSVAHARNVPVIFGCRKWATNKDRLERAGFPEIVTLPPPPEEPEEATPVPAPVLTETPPEEEAVVPAVPSVAPTEPKTLRDIYREVIRENPSISNKDAYEEARLICSLSGIRLGSERPDLLSQIRKELDIVMPKNTVARRIDTVPTSEVLPEVLAATPANVQPPTRVAMPSATPKDVKELVQLLRVAMEAEGIETLTVTKHSVKFRRIVVEEGSFDV